MTTMKCLCSITALVGFGGVYAAAVNGDAEWIGLVGVAGLASCLTLFVVRSIVVIGKMRVK